MRHRSSTLTGAVTPWSLILVAAIYLPGMNAVGAIVPKIRLKSLIEQADLVAVGRVVQVRDRGPATVETPNRNFVARQMVADLQIERLLKGQTAGSTLAFTFLLPEQMIGYWPIGANQFGVFFLVNSEHGYSILDPYHPYVVAAPGTPSTGGSAFDQIINELVTAIEAPSATRDVKVLAVAALDSTPGPEATAALLKGTASNNDEVRFGSIESLFRRNNLVYLDEAVNYLLRPPPGVNEELIEGMALAISVGVTSPDAIPALGRLLQASAVQTRRSAAMALRSIGTDAAAKPLARGLWDSDRNVRSEAAFGLARITGEKKWCPDERDYIYKSEEPHLSHWREWARGQK